MRDQVVHLDAVKHLLLGKRTLSHGFMPVECLEMEYPLLVEEYALVPDSGSPGHHRGGLGLRRTIRLRGGEATFLGTLDRARFAPWGLFGGREGGRASCVLNEGTPVERALPPKVAGLRLVDGDAVTIVTPGAGGYGPFSERDGARLARDLAEGKVLSRSRLTS